MRYVLFVTMLALLTGCNQKTSEVITVKKLGKVCEDIVKDYDADHIELILEAHGIEGNLYQTSQLGLAVAQSNLRRSLGYGHTFSKFDCVQMMKELFIENN